MAERTGKKAEYKSAIRSRKMIKTAFLELIQEKDWQKITVTDIITRCDLNRGTFYAHYQNVRDVMEHIQHDIISSIDEILTSTSTVMSSDNMDLITKINNEISRDLNIFKLLITSKNSALFSDLLKNLIIERTLAHTKDQVAPENMKRYELTTRFMAGGFVALYFDWISGNIEATPEEICDIINDILRSWYHYLT